ncbi:glycosyltransferase [Streptomyces sp. CB01580]|uniref:glycosyltransferase n=1 Tax=Streptomyces sp. CB01580 TaxID=1703933 RepID=UPI00093FAD40|nr:glycosyltransferase [Streptomyces sp. CB01580]OKJ43775.1 transferase [Streptomyces sp. CB01580]
MRIGFLTEGGCPCATGESGLWCDRLVRGLAPHEFALFVLNRAADQEEWAREPLPANVRQVRSAPLWTPDEDALGGHAAGSLLSRMTTGRRGRAYGRRERRRFATHFTTLATSICAARALDGEERARGSATGAPGGTGGSDGVSAGAGADGRAHAYAGAMDEGFAEGLYGLAELAREHGGLPAALRSETALRVLEAACRAPGSGGIVRTAVVADLLDLAREIEELLRPLSLDWYDDLGLGAVDLCHAASGGATALPGLLAKRFFGVPLLVTEHGARLRAHYLATARTPLSAPVRAVLAGFHRRFAAEVYRQAALITPGDTHARRWQERCGAGREKLRTVHPGLDPARFATLGESGDSGPDDTLVWVGRVEPAKDLVTLLHAFEEVRKAEPGVRLRIIGAVAPGPEGADHLARCRVLAARLFPGEAVDARTVDGGPVSLGNGPVSFDNGPVSFHELGGAEVPDVVDAYAAGGVVVLSSIVEHFPETLVEAMFCGRATVSTDVGAVVEVVGGTGLVVPPRNPKALADACLALLRDPERRARLGAAARARALELFTVEQNLAAFRGIYLELISRVPGRREDETVAADGRPRPFATPPEAHVLGPWTASGALHAEPVDRTPGWVLGPRTVCAGARGAGDGDA